VLILLPQAAKPLDQSVYLLPCIFAIFAAIQLGWALQACT